MKDYPVEFGNIRFAQVFGIFFNPVQANVYFPFYWRIGASKVKADDICVIVVLKELLINTQQIGIGTKNIAKGLKRRFFFLKNGQNVRL